MPDTPPQPDPEGNAAKRRRKDREARTRSEGPTDCTETYGTDYGRLDKQAKQGNPRCPKCGEQVPRSYIVSVGICVDCHANATADKEPVSGGLAKKYGYVRTAWTKDR